MNNWFHSYLTTFVSCNRCYGVLRRMPGCSQDASAVQTHWRQLLSRSGMCQESTMCTAGCQRGYFVYSVTMVLTSGLAQNTSPIMLYCSDMRNKTTAHQETMNELIINTIKNVTSLMDFAKLLIVFLMNATAKSCDLCLIFCLWLCFGLHMFAFCLVPSVLFVDRLDLCLLCLTSFWITPLYLYLNIFIKKICFYHCCVVTHACIHLQAHGMTVWDNWT